MLCFLVVSVSICIDTSYDYREKLLYICILIFRTSSVASKVYDEIVRESNIRYIHVRKLSRKAKVRLFDVMLRVLPKHRENISVRILALKFKSTNRFRKLAFVEKIIARLTKYSKQSIDRIVVPTDLNIGQYKFCDAIARKIGDDKINVVEDDSDSCVQLADGIVNLFRTRRTLPLEHYFSTHNC